MVGPNFATTVPSKHNPIQTKNTIIENVRTDNADGRAITAAATITNVGIVAPDRQMALH